MCTGFTGEIPDKVSGSDARRVLDDPLQEYIDEFLEECLEVFLLKSLKFGNFWLKFIEKSLEESQKEFLWESQQTFPEDFEGGGSVLDGGIQGETSSGLPGAIPRTILGRIFEDISSAIIAEISRQPHQTFPEVFVEKSLEELS